MASLDARDEEDLAKTKEQLIDELIEIRRRLWQQSQDRGGHPAVAAREQDVGFGDWAELLPQPVFEADISGTITFLNRRAFEHFRCTREDFCKGIKVFELLVPEDRGRAAASIDLLFRDEASRGCDYIGLRKDGTTFPVVVYSAAISVDGKATGFRGVIYENTERKQVEERLVWIEALLRQMSTSSPLGYLVVNNRTDEFLFFNDLFCEIWGIHHLKDGMQRGELKVDDVFPYCARLVKEPEAFSARCDLLRSGGDGSVTEDEIEFADGRTIRCFSARLCNETNRCFGRFFTVEDITARKRIEDALRENEVKFRLLSEQALLGIAIIQDGRAKYVNKAASALFGYSIEDITKWGSKELAAHIYRDDRWHVLDQAWKKLLGNQEAMPSYRFRLLTKNGTTKWVEIYSRTVSYEGKNADFIMIIDITDRKKAEKIMFQGERIKAVADLAGGVAHNFNNMLQIVGGGAQLALRLLEKGNIDAATEKLNLILDSSQFGAETVKRLQDFARVSTDRLSFAGKVFDLSSIVNEVVQMSKQLWNTTAEKQGVSISLQHDLEPDCLVKGSQNELFDVVVNLIKNSVEALPYGGHVHVRCFSDDHEVILEVQDSGVGIAQENLSKIFDPFWTTKGVRGTGMGLASTFGIVRRHHGTISVQSNEGKGAVFTVRLPLSHSSIEEDDNIETDFANWSLRLLIVDNDPTILTLLEDGLSEYGQKVVTAPSGHKAMEIFCTTSVDVVICDLGMPEMNGWQVGKALKEICVQKGIPKPPFILLTGWGAQINEQEELADSGFDRVVGKPVVIPKLLEIVRTVYETTGKTSRGA